MFTLPNLPYSYNALEPFIDGATMRVHHDGHHKTYVEKLNELLAGQPELLNIDIETLLKSLDKIPENIRTKVKNNAGGHYHHSIFWTIMTNNKIPGPSGKLEEMINQNFGNLNTFKERFSQSALNLFGSGWTWLILKDNKLTIENFPNQDSPISEEKYPLFAIDLWEHAYYLKFKNKRADYIQTWWNVVNWKEIESRLNKVLNV